MNKQFEEWLDKTHTKQLYMDYNAEFESSQVFDQLPFSMQWGVYLEFFDSVGISIFISGQPWCDEYWYEVNPSNMDCVSEHIKGRQEAQKMAIDKAFELLSE